VFDRATAVLLITRTLINKLLTAPWYTTIHSIMCRYPTLQGVTPKRFPLLYVATPTRWHC